MKVFLLIFLLLSWWSEGWPLQGVCSNCHTMHNSQGNQPMITDNSSTPNKLLLRMDCLGCHAQGGNLAIVNWNGSLIPQVYHTEAVDLAGGNFAYITGLKGGIASSDYGHNVISLVGPETQSAIGMYPPGGIKQYGHYYESGYNNLNDELNCAGENGCHGYRVARSGAKDVEAIKGAHHRNVKGWCNGTKVYDSFRFLVGVKGYEDMDWQYTSSPSDHNEYFGRFTPVKLGCSSGELSCHGTDSIRPPDGTISQFCGTCHGNFHTLQTPSSEGVGPQPASPFIRHPTDFALLNTGEYADYNNGTLTYSLLAPVARTSEPITGPSSTVTPGSDAVMCLSCHYAHAGPYPDMLRWDYRTCVAGGGPNSSCGCFVCHTNKD